MPAARRAFCYAHGMVGEMLGGLSDARVRSYRMVIVGETGRSADSISDRSVQSLYLWQSAIASAWYEALSIFEPVLRNRIDASLRSWNQAQSSTEDWLEDPARPLRKVVERMATDARNAAERSARRRPRNHPRFEAPVTLDDRVSQLSFGNLSALFPLHPPANRADFATGFSAKENLWIHALVSGFPGLTSKLVERHRSSISPPVPAQVEDGYAVAVALEQLRRLRNRVSHQEQILNVDHQERLTDMYALAHAMSPQTLGVMKKMDRIQRTLLLRPQY